MITIFDLEKKFKNLNLKLTNQRKAILEVLIENNERFLTAEEIYNFTRKKCSNTNFSTIYRNLITLENTRIIEKTILQNGVFVYGIVESDSHHHNIICKNCGKAESIDFCPLDEINAKLKDKNFMLTDHKFELYGYCKNCIKNLDTNKAHPKK